MSSHICQTKSDCEVLCSLIMNMKLPITVNVKKGKDRTVEQNKLQRLWLREATDQLQDSTIEEKRAYCKLHFGVPILRNENDEFREKYDRIIRPLSYEEKLEIMALPIDFPVTRLMTTGQSKRYLDDIYHHFTGMGCKLTDPEQADNR